MEKLHRLGDDEGARIIARRILISQTLSEDERSRIEKVINADKITTANVIVVTLTIIIFVYLYLQYVN